MQKAPKSKTSPKPEVKKSTEKERVMKASDYRLLRIRCETLYSAKPFEFHDNTKLKRMGQRAMQEYDKLTEVELEEFGKELEKLKMQDENWRNSKEFKKLLKIYQEIMDKESIFEFTPVRISIPGPDDEDYEGDFSKKEGFKLQVPVQFKLSEKPVLLDSFTVFGILEEEGFIINTNSGNG